MDGEEKKKLMIVNVHAFMKGETKVYAEVPEEFKEVLEVKETPDHDSQCRLQMRIYF
mgnify:CR=1 FL=1